MAKGRKINKLLQTVGKRRLAVLLVVVLLGGLLVAGVATHLHAKKVATTAPVCASEQLKAASTSLWPNDQAKLQPIVVQIKQRPRFVEDVNCLYVMVSYDVAIGDSADARLHMNMLSRLLPKAGGFDANLGKTKSLAKLESEVIFLEKAQHEPIVQMGALPNL